MSDELNAKLLQTPNLLQERLATLREWMPDLFMPDGTLNVKELKKLTGSEITESEFFEFRWFGKNDAKQQAYSPITKTLKYDLKRSVNPETADGNLVIEGDNLEVMKCLLASYREKIKCIYIDPPYNTGGLDLIYRDNFTQNKTEYDLENSNKDEEGKRLNTNPKSSGRFHSKWLNMLYPRLLVARQLLKNDGVIFISIDDNEVHNLRKICDEIFGESNFESCIKVYSNPRGRQSSLNIAETSEYILVYRKSLDCILSGEPLSEKQKAEYSETDNKGRYRLLGLRHRASNNEDYYVKSLDFPIFYSASKQDIKLERTRPDDIEIVPRLPEHERGRWTWSKKKVLQDKHLLYVKKNNKGRYDIFRKDYLTRGKTTKSKDMWLDKDINYDQSAKRLKDLFGFAIMQYTKPVYLIKKILQIATTDKSGDIILDFFAGSGTTSDAVMEMNAGGG